MPCFDRISRLAFPALAPLLAAALTGCAEGEDPLDGLNLFTIQDDINLGIQTKEAIEADPETYPVLDEAQYPEAYAHLYRMRDELLVSNDFDNAKKFEWELFIIEDDETLNAFCAPGGYIYVYTGLMKFLDQEDELVGVLGHEMAHADQRHSTEQLTEAYGIQTVANLLLGEDGGLAGQIASAVAGLTFSRADEAEADSYSVQYLCDTDYAADGAAGFFEQLLDESSGGYEIPEFLSTHPSSESRVADIEALAKELGCSTVPNPDADYQDVLNSLP